MSHSDVSVWWEWRTKNILPYPGGWFAQPLSLLAKMMAYDVTYSAYTSNKKGDGYALDKLTPTQAQVVSWLDG